ncbi:hypothetical protein CLAIMM_02908 [Cladophialophora immunda]|nr:hypothetical protein CLAIMM_02908 [Cladophialophora immunda]
MATTTTIHSWIHHDSQADRKSLSSQKSQVFRHVAAHRKWKRLQRTWNLRASALTLYHTFQDQGKQSPQLETYFAGSYDPFDSLAIPHTSQIDELLQFDRIHLSPAFGSSKIPLHPSAAYLQDELAAYGFLARIAAIKARCNPDQEAFNVVLKLKAKAMQQLRTNLSQTDFSRLPLAVMSLLYAETWCRNLEAVAVHLGQLEVINNRYELSAADLICILHSDIQRASLTLENPLFMMDNNAWEILEADCAGFLWPEWPEADAANNIQCPQRRLLLDMRNALVALDILKASETLQAGQQAVIIKFLHIMRATLERYNTSSDNIEQCAALAALYRLRLEANMERIPLFGITCFDAGKVILPKLKELLTTISNDPPNMRLWILFVGTMSSDDWFKEEFKMQADRLGLVDSEDVKAVLNVFEHRDLPDSRIDHLIRSSLSRVI